MKRLFVLFALGSLLMGEVAHGQNDIGTDKSQNTAQDLANSLIPAKPNLTKGEKKSEVDPKTLPSKRAPKDPLFSGGLNDIGVDWDGSKMAKLQDGNSSNSKSVKQSDAAGEKDAKTAKQTEVAGEKDSKASKAETKEQKVEAAKADEKPADKEKASTKSDGDH
jgi:hypothetical protein